MVMWIYVWLRLRQRRQTFKLSSDKHKLRSNFKLQSCELGIDNLIECTQYTVVSTAYIVYEH